MKLWSGTLSPFSAKVRIALAEKGLSVDITEIPWSRARLWGPKPEAFLAVSPKGEVPVLEDGDLAVVDSTVINEYLEERYPDVPLMPSAPDARAVCRMWEDMADHFLSVHVTVLIREVFMKAGAAHTDTDAVAASLAALSGYASALERRLADRDHLCGTFTLADVATWICLTFGQTLGVDLSPHPAVGAWYASVSERPVVASELALITTAAAAA